MFLDKTLSKNPGLIEAAFKLHSGGLIQPDTYVLDLDAILQNGRLILQEADKYGIKLYFMTKQFGRNPLIAKELMNLGYRGAVAVDEREAEVLFQNGIPIGHAGHLVQIPSKKIKDILLKNPEVITVYTVDKAKEISRAAKELGISQSIMLRVIDDGDIFYPGQYGGIHIERLRPAVKEIMQLPNINIHGVTTFPCFLFDEQTGQMNETQNIYTLIHAKQILKDEFGIDIRQVNTPSATCTSLIQKIASLGGTHGEPGHGLMGTTPLHAVSEQVEIPAIVYVSEISHSTGDTSYCYGGGYYRRSNVRTALVGQNVKHMRKVAVNEPCGDYIDYYIGLEGKAKVGEGVIFSFRTQVFVTRSEVAVIRGISSGNSQIIGIYDSLGKMLKGGV
jgi:Predicted amino acid racemase